MCLNTVFHTLGGLVDFRIARKHSLVFYLFFMLKWLTFVDQEVDLTFFL